MKRFLLLFSLTDISWSANANAAMPGIWNTGKGGTLQLVFRGDSVHFGKIKMKRELVLVNLYPGFAVVKGEYYFINNSGEKVRSTQVIPCRAPILLARQIMCNTKHLTP